MNQPLQNPPVERLYMRRVVGRQSLPQPAKASPGGAKGPKGRSAHAGGDYLLELTTFHIRPRRPAGRLR
jgi:hypothetical protein